MGRKLTSSAAGSACRESAGSFALRGGKFGLTLLACSVAAIFLAGPASAHNDDENARSAPVVRTVEGVVRGYTESGVSIFKGIPYAAPPVGDLRWRPPQPVKRWKSTLDATEFGSHCPQVTTLATFAGPTSTNEDCLFLNVFTPNKGGKKAVIVWVHGGGNYAGGSADYDASKLATGGPDGVPTVVVTLNYRFGLLGIFSHPAINNEGHLWGNYAALDVNAVLRWVQRNIAAFGGDPTRVAVGGQSGGAHNVGVQVVSPLSNGLFNRAIAQSSPSFIFPGVVPAATASSRGQSFAEAAGCPGSSAAAAKCLRKLSIARILQLQGRANAANSYFSQSIIDGTIIPADPQAVAAGRFNKMPILGGSTKDESTFNLGNMEYFTDPLAPMTSAQYEALTPANVLAQYPISNYGNNPGIAFTRSKTDQLKCSELHNVQLLASHVPVYAYDFRYQNSPYYAPQMPGFKALAAHTIDIQYLFAGFHGGNLGVNIDQETGQPRELNEQETKLSNAMVAAWTNFARSGNPNGSGNSPWPQFTGGGNAKYLVQDMPLSTITVSQLRSDYKCDFWDSVLGY
ncbi:carboxylesterase/lipase family protein [Hyphomicrobium sp.]|uniref:carboxylesterase/lipase family protein n=1 Tax=Hyphomicrobium sp. TaxID=82 RepID=UPI003563849C